MTATTVCVGRAAHPLVGGNSKPRLKRIPDGFNSTRGLVAQMSAGQTLRIVTTTNTARRMLRPSTYRGEGGVLIANYRYSTFSYLSQRIEEYRLESFLCLSNVSLTRTSPASKRRDLARLKP